MAPSVQRRKIWLTPTYRTFSAVSTGTCDRLWVDILSQYVISQLGQPSLASKSSTSFGRGKGWNVTSAGWQVTLCDPIWHLNSISGVATSVSELLYACYFTYFTLRYHPVSRWRFCPHLLTYCGTVTNTIQLRYESHTVIRKSLSGITRLYKHIPSVQKHSVSFEYA